MPLLHRGESIDSGAQGIRFLNIWFDLASRHEPDNFSKLRAIGFNRVARRSNAVFLGLVLRGLGQRRDKNAAFPQKLPGAFTRLAVWPPFGPRVLGGLRSRSGELRG
jgi:hypothetical protein